MFVFTFNSIDQREHAHTFIYNFVVYCIRFKILTDENMRPIRLFSTAVNRRFSGRAHRQRCDKRATMIRDSDGKQCRCTTIRKREPFSADGGKTKKQEKIAVAYLSTGPGRNNIIIISSI